jgi:hypothetical protein
MDDDAGEKSGDCITPGYICKRQNPNPKVVPSCR